MTTKEMVKVLEDLKDHSCEIPRAEYSYYFCCHQRDYLGHKPDCERIQALTQAIEMIERIDVEKIRSRMAINCECYPADEYKMSEAIVAYLEGKE